MSSKDGEREWIDRVIKDIAAPTGLSSVFARGTIKRALERVGLDLRTMTADDFDRALPVIRQALAVYPFSDEGSKKGGGEGEGGTPAAAEAFVEPLPEGEPKKSG
jgi:hypothetical protein